MSRNPKLGESFAADVVAYVVELVLETHERAGTDLLVTLQGMAHNYRAKEPQALRVVREALDDADRLHRERLHFLEEAASAYCEFCGEIALYEYTTPGRPEYRRFSCTNHAAKARRLVKLDNGVATKVECRALREGPKA